MNRRVVQSFLATLILAIVPVAASGQSSLDPGTLPKNTAFYLTWHGTPSSDARKVNSLLALWDDPDFAPVRAAMFEGMLQNSAASQKIQNPMTREELSQYASLLDNEFVVGYIGNPSPPKAGGPGLTASTWNGFFLVYDRTGQEATLAKLLLRTRTNEKDPPKVSTTTLAGISAIKEERKTGISYWAEDGKYTFSASEPAVFAQIAAWTRHATPGSAVLSQTDAYREASNLLKGGVVEFFFHFPSIKETNWDTSAGGFRLRPLLQSLKLEAVHVIAGHLSLEGARTRMQGAILGEARPGTLFDIWDESTAAATSWQFVNSKTVSFQESRLNLLGIYGLVKRALQSTAGAGQRSPMDFVETAAATRLGMPLPAAIGLFSGEFATLQTSATLEPAKQVYVVGIQKKAETLKLLRAGFADRVAGERAEGGTTFLKVSEGGIESSTGTASWKYYHLGVTNDAIVVSSRNESVRETVAARTNAGDLQAPQSWQAARAQFPARINGLSFFDFQQVDWAAVKARWSAESRKPRKAANNEKARSEAFANALQELNPQVFPRHLHLVAGASWKDDLGLHFDGWVE
jgi:hypothetical protein